MKYKYFVLSAVLTFAVIQANAKADVLLGSAANFGLLGGSGVTNTGSSVVNNGNVGSAPTPVGAGFGPGVVNNGTLYTAANSVTAQAHTDLIAAYTAAQAAQGGTTGANLGGAILNPGIYIYAFTAPWTAGNLTLDASGDPHAQWIFQIGTALTTPAGVSVVLINGASPDNVFWQIGTSATLGAANSFAGNILAQTSITIGGGTLDGRALAIDGLVSITAAETVNVPEPATMSLLGLGLIGLIARRRQSSK